MVAVVHTASTSATGSARNTAKGFVCKEVGQDKDQGMSRMIFRRGSQKQRGLGIAQGHKGLLAGDNLDAENTGGAHIKPGSAQAA